MGQSGGPDEPTISEVGEAWIGAHAAIAQRMLRFERALIEIRDHDPVDNALDSQWAARIAAEALDA